ncbi:PREDICTED: formin-like protein 3 [Ceratosolen solmsi marchali]|uniref:Formin-like protein 3 n=1 Tax=Ceratosolen solmsi marchali TaxID=326594 RepID=A0AAJ7E014_9HYME|nr:PREDICTED: formin-like protein 3 [Ceratosolen solmsi marchali]
MTSRRAGPEGQRDPRSPNRSSGGSEDNGFGRRPRVSGLQEHAAVNLDQRARFTGSLQNLARAPSLVPPPVPPRTPQVRQPRQRGCARPLPPLPPTVQPSTSQPQPQSQPHPQPQPQPQSQSQAQLPPQPPPPPRQPTPPPLPPERSCAQVQDGQTAASEAPSPEEPNQNEEEETAEKTELTPILFARCNPSAGSSRHPRDEDETAAEEAAVQGTRLRPPLAGTVALSADSGTGDTADSLEAQIDGSQHRETPANTEAKGEADEVADDEKLNELEKLRDLDQRLPAGETPTLESKFSSAKGNKQQVKPFTKASLDRLESRHVQLVRDYGFQPKRKTSVEDGGVLPNKFEPFPSNLYGRPLEEIDNFIYDEVSVHYYYMPHFRILLLVRLN